MPSRGQLIAGKCLENFLKLIFWLFFFLWVSCLLFVVVVWGFVCFVILGLVCGFVSLFVYQQNCLFKTISPHIFKCDPSSLEYCST